MMFRRRHRQAATTAVLWLSVAIAPAAGSDARNAGYLQHIDRLARQQPVAAALVRQAWLNEYHSDPRDFIPDTLALLHPRYRDALRAFERRAYPAAAAQFAALRAGEGDPYVTGNALYFQARSLVASGAFEEAEALLTAALTAADALEAHTPYVPHLRMLSAASQAANLRTTAALATLEALLSRDGDLPEAVLMGARQLLLELERQGGAPLDEVRRLMAYVAARLRAIDAGDLVRERQQSIIDLLDDLIDEAEQQEGQSGQCGAAGQQPAGGAPQPQGRGAERSTERSGPGRIGELQGAPEARPGEFWGELPPAERDRILQDLRERYPSRYRQLVEQYYRALSEDE